MPELLSGEMTLSTELRHAQMQQAVNMGLPFMRKATSFHDQTLTIVGYGPSLQDSWQSIEYSDSDECRPILATSGAYDFLLARGIIPHFYCAIDPRQSTVELLKEPHANTWWFMASVCHPDWWEKLKDRTVKLWHLINDNQTVEWVKTHHPAGLDSMIGGGSTVAQRAMNVGAALGYRKFEVFGVDCSFVDQPHAGPHNAERQPTIEIPYNGRAFKTTPQLLQSAQELREFMLTADVEINFHGDGLIQEIAKTIKKRKS